MFSEMVEHFVVPTNRLYQERDDLLRRGRKIIDLVSGNVNALGIHYPAEALKRALTGALPAAKTYHPDPLGQPAARQAISRYYHAEGVTIPPEQVVLTPGTSISYWYAFKTLANFGDEILCPRPSYPLFESIAALCGVRLVSYPLREGRRWEIDFDALESVITTRTRAIILISPHNPTGAVATEDELETLAAIAARKNLPIISDEVFSPFLYASQELPRPTSTRAPLVLTLNGFSKMFALPGIKIGWMGVTGDPTLVKKTLKALEMISDTFLPVNEIAQFAVPALFKQGGTFLKQYRAEIRSRTERTMELFSKVKGISFIPPEGGFYMTLRLMEGMDEEKMALHLLKGHNLLVHPGYFYDLEGNHLVFSFVSEATALRKALSQLTISR